MSKPGFILIADDFHPELCERLQKAGLTYKYLPDATRAIILSELENGATGLLIRSKTPVDGTLLASAKTLQWIGRGGSGMDNIDLETASQMGIDVFNAAAANADAVAEHTLGMLLSLLHKLATADAEVRRGLWNREANRGTELKGKTVGIIGLGHTGSAVARRLLGFGVTVVAHDKYRKDFGNEFIEEVSLDELKQRADIVTLHVPLTPETRNLIDPVFIHACKKPFWLLNLCRGEVVNTEAVVQALENNHIAGFAADVLEKEGFNQYSEADWRWFNALRNSPRTLLAPHIGGWTHESYRKIALVLADNVINRMSHSSNL